VSRNSAQRIASALITPQAFSYSGGGQHVGSQDTPESLALIPGLEAKLDIYLKVELEILYDEMKESKALNKMKFRRADAEIRKRFEGLKKEVGEGEELVGLFEELGDCLVSEVGMEGKGSEEGNCSPAIGA
jgi:hypothetical protein